MEAAGLASSIITFIDFSYKLIDGSTTIYQQVQGGSGANLDTRKIVDDLQAITKQLSQTTPAPPTLHEQALASIAGHCNTLSNELVALLRSFEPKADGNKALRSLEAAFKTLRKTGKIREIEQKLDSYKLQLLLRLNMMLCDSGRAVGSQIKTMQQDHATFFSKNIQELQSVKVTVETLESKVLRLAQVVTSGNTSAATADIEHSLSLNQTQLDLASFKKVIAALPQQTPTHFHVLDRLNFDRLFSRVDSVKDGQFDRFLSRLESKELGAVTVQARDAVRLWGTKGGIVLHISGKPGSGKSTLMKLLSQNEGLHDTLTTWAGGKKLVIARLFFWNAGSPLEKSLEGLYRSILFQVLRQCPDLADHVFPQSKHQSSNYEQHTSSSISYRQFELQNAMELLIQSFTKHCDYRLCLFVDGLDELDGKSHDYQKLAKQLREWATNPYVRICTSSRPYHEFHHVFGKIARINLHELTDPDIYEFSHKILMDSNDGHLEPEEIHNLAREITHGSEGVFLWARIVAHTLSEGILHGDTYRSLEAKILNTPKDLTDFLLHLFQSISPEDRGRAYLLLLTLREWPTHSFNAIAVSWMEDLEDGDFPYNRPRCAYTDEQVGKCVQYAERQLKLVCKGLLELRSDGHEKDLYFGQRIEFFHRTALDFVRQPEIVLAMQQHLGNRAFGTGEF
ncbi:hypothetical protein F5X68DRAFT_263347 [Plectosphaerella plurivora]|uniref:NACHT domain-containing protein n=1 Tax=Plectosphaerella plurivora TaxID=936078 RepID=A0A9P8V8P9_9PEZI|nr:hypothetical protein F5X68DRAFT_263347 [Plectosphaerella plurivora]